MVVGANAVVAVNSLNNSNSSAIGYLIGFYLCFVVYTGYLIYNLFKDKEYYIFCFKLKTEEYVLIIILMSILCIFIPFVVI